MHDGQIDVATSALAQAIREQLPEYADLPLRRVSSAGTVVAPFRLGDRYVVRLPLVPDSDPAARGALTAWGRHAAALDEILPIQVSGLVAVGAPFPGYPGWWSIWTWVDGVSADQLEASEVPGLATDVAEVLRSIHRVPARRREWSGTGRGASPLADSAWVRTSINRSAHLIDPVAATAVWERALAAEPHADAPVSIHGDPMPGNLIVEGGRLVGLIDIAEPAVGDPASDLAPAWTLFDEPERSTFRAEMGLGDAAWERGRGWAFEMAIGGLHYYERSNPVFARQAAQTLHRLIDTM